MLVKPCNLTQELMLSTCNPMPSFERTLPETKAPLPADPTLPPCGRNLDFLFESPATFTNLGRHGKHPIPQFRGILDPLASPALKNDEPMRGPNTVVIFNEDEVDPKLNKVPGLYLL